MSAVQTETIVGKYHLNGIDPSEAKALRVEGPVKRRIEAAARVLASIENSQHPEYAQGVSQLLDFEMKLNRHAARVKGTPVNLVHQLAWHLVSDKLTKERKMGVDQNASADVREETAREMLIDPGRATDRIVRGMELGAHVRYPGAQMYRERRVDQLYNTWGVDTSHARPRAGLFVPFQQGFTGYDMTTPEINIPIYGFLEQTITKPDFSHLIFEHSDHAEQGRGRRFYRTPAFSGSFDGHLVAMTYPTESDILYGMQFDNPEFLSALTFAGLTNLEDFREIARMNRDVHQGIAQRGESIPLQPVQ